MEPLLVPGPVREKLGDAGSDGLMMMFADAHQIATEKLDRRIAEVSASFEHRLAEEISKFRLEVVERISDLRFDVLKWSFVFWIGQMAMMTAILSLLLRGAR